MWTSCCRRRQQQQQVLLLLAMPAGLLWSMGVLWQNLLLQGPPPGPVMDWASGDLEKNLLLASSGQEFSGRPVRTFEGRRLFQDVTSRFTGYSVQEPRLRPAGSARCRSRKWGVLTTVQEPTEAVRRLLYRTGWCVVVVGDWAGPESFRFNHTDLGDNIVFLGSEDQGSMQSSFVKNTPWNSFARKNVGFLYAMAAGAQIIWDFDDDNMLKFWLEGASTDQRLEIQTYTKRKGTLEVLVPTEVRSPDFNPYPILGCPIKPCWPRGFPLRSVYHQRTVELKKESVPVSSLAVLQSLADHDPDVDAIFRLTMGTPMDFKRNGSLPNPLLLPKSGAFSPMNAQAALHFRPGFFALYLPSTVHGRVADIWRSYVAQAVFQVMGLRTGFLPRPLVTQNRNLHSYIADLEAEVPLYTQAGALLDYLAEWVIHNQDQSSPVAQPESLMEDIYVGLYERGFVELEDIARLQQWLRAVGNLDDFEATDLDLGTPAGARVTDGDLPQSCDDGMRKRHLFWTSDMHEGTRHDTPTVLAHLGQMAVLAGSKGGKFLNRAPLQRALNGTVGGVRIFRNLSHVLQKYKTFNNDLGPYEIQSNFEYYRDSESLKSVDAFVCSFPASLCQLWAPFNKSMVFLPAHRYNLGRCSPREWRELNAWLEDLCADEGRSHLLGGLSRYDLEYLKYYTGLPDVRLVSSLGSFYTAGNEFSPTKDDIPVFSLTEGSRVGLPGHFRMLLDTVNESNSGLHLRLITEMYHKYEFSDLVSYRAAILLAYSVMSYKLTELYALGIPIFVPSPAYYKRHGGLGPDRPSTGYLYCKNKAFVASKAGIGNSSTKASHPYDPNLSFFEDREAEMYWLQLSDFYEWPHITLFDNARDLEAKLKALEPMAVHERMVKSFHIRKRQTLDQWCRFIKKLG